VRDGLLDEVLLGILFDVGGVAGELRHCNLGKQPENCHETNYKEAVDAVVDIGLFFIFHIGFG
jgi:hypothetical protein